MSGKQPVNIFETLRDNDSSEEETTVVQKQKDPNQKRIRPKKNKDVVPPVTSINEPVTVPKENVQDAKHPRDAKPDRKVSGEPHPKDRQSGTGRGKEMRKGGQGNSNWGTYKDDLREEPESENKEAKAEPVEEVDDSLTLSELLAQKKLRQA